jgi:hypothetical protein
MHVIAASRQGCMAADLRVDRAGDVRMQPKPAARSVAANRYGYSDTIWQRQFNFDQCFD